MTKPIANDAIYLYVERVTKETGKCPFTRFDDTYNGYCHFAFDFGCSHYGKLVAADQKREYCRCEL
jgi:hypothetical protein